MSEREFKTGDEVFVYYPCRRKIEKKTVLTGLDEFVGYRVQGEEEIHYPHCVGESIEDLRKRFRQFVESESHRHKVTHEDNLKYLKRTLDSFNDVLIKNDLDSVTDSEPSTSPHRLAAQAVLADLGQRKGIDAVFEELEDEVRDEIENEIGRIIKEVFVKEAIKNTTAYFARFTPQEIDRIVELISKGTVDVSTPTPTEPK